jgi:hypothetical protein
MSWWDTGNKDDVIGDQPADLVRHVLQEIVETRAQRSEPKPKLADLLRAIGIVATTADGKMFEDVPGTLREIVAELKSGQTVSSGLLPAVHETNDLVSILTRNLNEIAKIYQERWERNLRLSEWLETFSFVLRYRPEEFLDDGVAHPPSELKAVTGDSRSRH